MRWLVSFVLVSVIWTGCSDETIEPSGLDISATVPDSGAGDIAETDTAAPSPCEGKAEGSACDDGDPCTLDDSCSAGTCVGGTNDPCETDNPCEVGVCVAGEGCAYEPAQDGTTCSATCFNSAMCQGGTCQVDPESAVVCPDPGENQPCVADLQCDQATGECTVEVLAPAGTGCNVDSNLCTDELCTEDGTCEATGDINACDDEKDTSPCEFWKCDKKNGECQSTGFKGEISCNDGEGCTENDLCNEDEFGFISCKGNPINVDDNNPCTDDGCKDGVIDHAPIDGKPCETADACTPTGLCEAGSCEYEGCECSVDADCEQPADKCLGVAYCDLSGDQPACKIKQDSPVVCEDTGNPCTANTCQPDTGACAEVALEDGIVCDDKNACTTGDTCQGGTCQAGDPVPCDNGLFCDGKETCDPKVGCQAGDAPELSDDVDCTVDSCDEDSDTITHTPNDNACDNGLYCDGSETCDANKGCAPGDAPDLSDGVDCTVDSCDEASDTITHTPNDKACDNGLYCDGSETCDANKGCTPGEKPELSDGIDCTVDSCDEASDTITHTPNDKACDNGLYCDGSETCDANKGCTPGDAPDLSDGVDCTVDSCDEASDTITHTPNDKACDNGLYCDGSETCDANKGCTPGDAPDLSDGVDCTVGSCDEASDTITHTPNDKACDNGLYCDGSETCDANKGCTPGDAPELSDGVECTLDSCDEDSDTITHTPNDKVCDNGLYCDGSETCDVKEGCTPGDKPDLSDGVDCTVDSCDEASDQPVHTPNDKACDNGLYCDGSETCDVKEGCTPGDKPDLSDGFDCTVDSCDEANDQPVHTANDKACDNGLYCDGSETCDANKGCTPGDAPDLSDGFDCTVDSCDEANDQPVHTANDKACDDGDVCTQNTCTLDSGCTYPVLADDTPCGDGLWCQAGECVDQQTCGDGNVQGSEVCDDGEANESGDGACLSDCSGLQICGDDQIQGSEDCDGPNCCACTEDELNPNQCVLQNSVTEAVESAKLTVSDGAEGDEFGWSVSISGDTLVVGSKSDDDKGKNSGSVYVYTRVNGVWSETQKITASDGAENVNFGWSVSISGDTLVVGALYDDDKGKGSGSAYVYTRVNGVWSETQKITASDGAENVNFGWSVSISSDTLVVGAQFDDDKGTDSGSAYVYTRVNGVWSETQKLTASDGAAGDQFGGSVSISSDTLVVGAQFDDDKGTDSGSAYVYTRVNSVWSETQKLTASDGAAGDQFGGSVSINDDCMVVGAQFDDDKGTDSGSIYVYPRVNGVWYEKQKITASDGAGGDRFGVSVSIHGPCMVVGASWDDDKGDRSGGAYGLTRVNGVWMEAQKVTASDGAGGDWFGWSASIFDFTLVVGAMGDDDKGSSSGSAYVFDLSPNCLTPDTCECKPGYVGPTCADTECGDNIVAGDEVCDDGNNLDGDGCSAVCEEDGPAASCLDVLNSNPQAEDGVYTIDPDGAGGDAPLEAFCDMTTAGGGWTRVLLPDVPNMDAPKGLNYSLDSVALREKATRVMVGYVDTSDKVTMATHFKLPPSWVDASPLSIVTGSSVAEDLVFNEVAQGNKTVMHGYGNPKGYLCGEGFGNELPSGNFCIVDTQAPFFTRWAINQTDRCGASDENEAEPSFKACSPERLFAMYLR
jgi:hypothetical protein